MLQLLLASVKDFRKVFPIVKVHNDFKNPCICLLLNVMAVWIIQCWL